MNELFDLKDLRQSLCKADKLLLVDRIIRDARLGAKYLYARSETAGLLHVSLDEIQTLLFFYRLDCTCIRSSIKIPWWSLCEYLIDDCFDVDKAVDDFITNMPHKRMEQMCPKKTA